MECKDFQKLINDFIFDKIEYSEDLKEFLNHAKTCKNCGEELELYYTIRRGLGDVKAQYMFVTSPTASFSLRS